MAHARRIALNLALQGGGVHGAFTWGVLDRLLDDEAIEFRWVSAGAMNATALASGLLAGGRQAARERLSALWRGVSAFASRDVTRLNPLLFGLTRAAMGTMNGIVSPYEFNPLGVDPLRELVERVIDFKALAGAHAKLDLVITATDVATGRARRFRRAEISSDVLLASACLPTLHHAVEIGGRAYWDGGFSANPDLLEIAGASRVGDTLMVVLNPLDAPGTPRGAREIAGAANRITFNQPLLRDVDAILAARRQGRGWFHRRTREHAIAAHRFHMITAGRYTAALSHDSKSKPDAELIGYLYNVGRGETEKWLANARQHVGLKDTADLETRFALPDFAPARRPLATKAEAAE
ncbi:MAG TPA: patatin-like phospholipase family protein [Hyphomicrobiaceae bacterium]|nr:patatin-like phospholipase family protein [Hyphomicrobiaceae bacterium]